MIHIEEETRGKSDRSTRVAGVRFQPTGRVYSFDASSEPELLAGDFVLVETSRGQQLGEVVTLRPPENGENNLSPVLRRATGRDLALRMEWQEKEAEALQMAEDMAITVKPP